MGIVRSHGEADSRGPDGFFAAGNGETGKEATGWDLAAGRDQERSEGRRELGSMEIY